MYAIVRKSDGSSYPSMVFGYYRFITAKEDYQRYLESVHNQFYIVLNEEKTKLIAQIIFDWNAKYLDPLILITDETADNWNIDENGCGCVSYLDSEHLWEAVKHNQVSPKLLQQCIDADKAYSYSEWVTVTTQQDIENLLRVSGDFHDGYIEKIEQLEDKLYVCFQGLWGCSIELWFYGNVAYQLGVKANEEFSPYWSTAALFQENDAFYLIDDGKSIAELTDDDCYLKGTSLKYHVIPNAKKIEPSS